MAKNNAYQDQDDEFHFDELDEKEKDARDAKDASGFNAFAEDPEAGGSKRNVTRFVLVAFCVFLIVLASWQMVQLFLPFKSKNVEQTLDLKPNSEELTTSRQSKTQTKTQTRSQPADQVSFQVSLEDKKKLDVLSDLVQQSNATVSRYSEQWDTMHVQVSQLNDKLNQFTARWEESMTQLTQLQQKITELETAQAQLKLAQANTLKAQPIKHKLPKKTAERPQVYYIKAVIPGRAWLITETGSTMTVSVGVSVPGYGQVVNIDAYQGLVTTSSGKPIGFSPEDS